MNTHKGSGHSSFLAEAHGTGVRHPSTVRFHATNQSLARQAAAADAGSASASAAANVLSQSGGGAEYAGGAARRNGQSAGASAGGDWDAPQRWASASTSSFSTTERARLHAGQPLHRSFNLSAETGVPKHLETIGHRAAVRTAALSQSQRSDGAVAAAGAAASAAAGAGGGEQIGGARKRAKSASAPGAARTSWAGDARQDPVGSRPRYTFSAPPVAQRPRHPLPEDPFSLTSYTTPYRTHPSYAATRGVCMEYRAAISEYEKKQRDHQRIAALVARYGAVTAARGQMQITGGAGSKGKGRAAVSADDFAVTQQRLPTSSAPPPPHLPANPNSPTFRFPRRIAYDPSDFEDFSKRTGRGDTFYRPLSVEEQRFLAMHKAQKGRAAGSGQW